MRRGPGLAAVVALGLALGCVPGPREASGPDLAQRLGCFACHALGGRGGGEAAPLDGVGTRFSREELATVLSYPRRVRPGARMPSYHHLRPEERAALLGYLESLK